jgi:protein-tyrosine-phosphatase
MSDHEFNGFDNPPPLPPSRDERTQKLIAGIVDDLAYKYDGIYDRETVTQFVSKAYDSQATGASVTKHLALFTQRVAEEQLVASAQANGLVAKATPEVLFICVHNAGRSQMAAAFLHHVSGGRVHVRSAGSQPGDQVSPVATEVMAEVGIELVNSFPKPLTNDVVRAADVIITMGCGDACPIYPGKLYLDWDLPDPAGLPVEQVRPIRDEIGRRVQDLLEHTLFVK